MRVNLYFTVQISFYTIKGYYRIIKILTEAHSRLIQASKRQFSAETVNGLKLLTIFTGNFIPDT